MVDTRKSERGRACTPTVPGWAEFTIRMECTKESAWSLPVYLYSLVCGALHYLGWTHATVAAFPHPLTGSREQYEGARRQLSLSGSGCASADRRRGQGGYFGRIRAGDRQSKFSATADTGCQQPISDEILPNNSDTNSRQHDNKQTVRTNDRQRRPQAT